MVSPRELSFSTPDALSGHMREIVLYVWGDEKAERTALCVHGLTRNGRDFDILAKSLVTRGFRVLCPDMPGRGKSPALPSPEGYSNAAYASELSTIMTKLGAEKFDWIGTSMGGIIALMFAASTPGRIGRLVLNDLGAVISAKGLSRIMAYAGNRLIFKTRAEGEVAMRNIFAPFGITDEAHWQHMFAHSLAPHDDGTYTLAYDPAIISSLPKPEGEIKDVELWPFMPAISAIPTLLIRGQHSDLLTHETAVEMKKTMPLLTLYEAPGAGHAPALMNPADVKIIGDWLTAETLS